MHDKSVLYNAIIVYHDRDYEPTNPERYNKYMVSHLASDRSTFDANAPTIYALRNELATSLSLTW